MRLRSLTIRCDVASFRDFLRGGLGREQVIRMHALRHLSIVLCSPLRMDVLMRGRIVRRREVKSVRKLEATISAGRQQLALEGGQGT